MNPARFFLLILCVSTTSFSGCFKEDEGHDTLLDKKYKFIAGILTADSLDDYRHEVFVGDILPKPKDEHVPAGEDPWTYLVTITMHQFYRATFEGDDGTAIVSIHKPNGDSVVMQPVGNGFYRDVNNELNIQPSTLYRLSVYSDDKYYSGQTTTPGYFRSTLSLDTVVLPVKKDFTIYKGQTTFPLTSSLGAFFYRDWSTIQQFTSNNKLTFEGDAIDHFFGSSQAVTFVAIDTSCVRDGVVGCYVKKSHETVAVDFNYARIYRAGATFTGTQDWFIWFDQYNSLPVIGLPARSSIQGDGVGGVFGSIYRVRKSYVVRPYPID